jgi:hypothetical protein
MISYAQVKTNQSKKTKNYPNSFTISNIELEKIMNEKLNTSLKFPSNIYLDKSILQMNSKNGDMHFVKLKLAYFTKSYLMIQENGNTSTIMFIMSEDKSVFYKGKIEKEIITFKKCSEDDIVSE